MTLSYTNDIEISFHYVKDCKHLFADILEIADNRVKPILKRELLFYSKIDARIVCASHENRLVGYYIYMPATKFLFAAKWLGVKSFLSQNGIDISSSTVPCYAFVETEREDEALYIELNKARVSDARNLGYKYGLVGLNFSNSSIDEDSKLCKQRKWMNDIDFFASITNTTYKEFLLDGVDNVKRLIVQEYHSGLAIM